jgi:hypothetical protein
MQSLNQSAAQLLPATNKKGKILADDITIE